MQRKSAYYGLHALQHRGQEGAGIVVTDGKTLQAVKVKVLSMKCLVRVS